MRSLTFCSLLFSLYTLAASPVANAANRWGLESSSITLQSAGPLAFGPDGVLLVGDPKAATVYAIATSDQANKSSSPMDVAKFETLLKSAFHADSIAIVDLAVSPVSNDVFVSLTADDKANLARVDAAGKVHPVKLTDVESARINLPNAPEDKVVENGRRAMNPRTQSITDIAYADGRVLISGLSGKSGSTVWEVALPFRSIDEGTPIEIYHAAHGRVEDSAPVRTFIPITVNGEPSLVAGYTCTPLVRFSLNDLKDGEKVRGTTVAELGNRNQPLDMIHYQKDGKDFLLMANSARGVMKISMENIDRKAGLEEPVKGGGTAGQSFETIDAWQGVEQLDRIDDTHAVLLVRKDNELRLQAVDLP